MDLGSCAGRRGCSSHLIRTTPGRICDTRSLSVIVQFVRNLFILSNAMSTRVLECYSQKHPANCSVDDFNQQTVECVKQQIVQSCLFDEKDNIVACKDGYNKSFMATSH